MANRPLNILKMWSISGLWNAPNQAEAVVTAATKKSLLSDSAKNVLVIIKNLINFDKKLSSWTLTPLVYDCYVSGLLYATAIRYTGKGSDVLSRDINEMFKLLDVIKASAKFDPLTQISSKDSKKVVNLYQNISLNFLSITGYNLKTPLTEMMMWVTSHSDDFGSDGVVIRMDNPNISYGEQKVSRNIASSSFVSNSIFNDQEYAMTANKAFNYLRQQADERGITQDVTVLVPVKDPSAQLIVITNDNKSEDEEI